MYSMAGTIWIMICIILVFIIQPGFALVETGLTRSKNAGNIMMKKLMGFAIGALAFFIVGFGLMYNGSNSGVVGSLDLFANNAYTKGYPTSAFLMIQIVISAIAVSIAAGAMTERISFRAYLIYSVVISAIVYPVSGHWIWNENGWLRQMGFHDFSGSAAINLVGGVAALIGAKMLGARIGKYDENGKSNVIPGQNMPISILGVFLLWAGWIGFSGVSIFDVPGDAAFKKIAGILLVTNICAAASGITTLFITWYRYGKSDVPMSLSGVLAGLAAIASGCDVVSPAGAIVIGVAVAFIVVFGMEFVDNKCRIDDPTGAVTVHGLGGAAGALLTGIFSRNGGVLYTGRFDLLGIQLVGVLAVGLWTAGVMAVVFWIIKKTVGLRVSEEEEIMGLDKSEHGLDSIYTDFTGSYRYNSLVPSYKEVKVREITVDSEPDKSDYLPDCKIRKVVILMNQSKFEILREELDRIDITGMTVTHVLGCGIQKGNTEYYRGQQNQTHLLPKIKVEIVISTVPLRLLIDTVKRVLYTGKIGDGKIFVYEVENVIKVRTSEEGKAALE